ncbi:hypothetical protein [Streptomyces viridochromogenes]|uniref:hypothetical protein n=1 Tax=Streptomyces viridochromogenes TaxID=1938 RepID=UPI0002FA80E9|nr:hypothetical protein [Streptomyces viridochromogenes]
MGQQQGRQCPSTWPYRQQPFQQPHGQQPPLQGRPHQIFLRINWDTQSPSVLRSVRIQRI